MILLSFTVRNHKSIRDEVTLDLVRPSLRTLQPKDADWVASTYPLAGIFGGNATGKSALLHAIRYAFRLIKGSSSLRAPDKSEITRYPFKLADKHEESTSLYVLDFVHNDCRYEYGFELDARGVKREWLKDVPKSRWRKLFSRERDGGSDKFDGKIRTLSEVTEYELVFNRALLVNHRDLGPIARDLVSWFDAVLVRDSFRQVRLSHIAGSLKREVTTYRDLELLLQLADIGITDVGIEESEHAPQVRKLAKRLDELRARGRTSADEGANDSQAKYSEDDLIDMTHRLTFKHRGSSESTPDFSIGDQSDGTLAWLAMAVPALSVLRHGGLLVVDEIDASLHPHLVDLMLRSFADPEVNIHHGQLIFTSHDPYVLSPLSETELEPEQVWFTDKTYDGATELFCQGDFPKRSDANVARRYLTGRYGGVPMLSPGTIATLIDSDGPATTSV